MNLKNLNKHLERAGIDLPQADLDGIELYRADLREANLSVLPLSCRDEAIRIAYRNS